MTYRSALCVSCNDYYVHRYGGRFVGNRYGAGSGSIWIMTVRCSGPETHITDCEENYVVDCTHSEDVSVSCIPGILTNSLQLKH